MESVKCALWAGSYERECVTVYGKKMPGHVLTVSCGDCGEEFNFEVVADASQCPSCGFNKINGH